jgi:hypothetical protein
MTLAAFLGYSALAIITLVVILGAFAPFIVSGRISEQEEKDDARN